MRKNSVKKRRSPMRVVGDIVVVLIIIALLGTAAYLLYKEFYPNNTPILKMQVMNQDGDTVTIDWDALRAQNPDTVGWLTIDGTNIDTPIVQTTDNNLYLYTAFDGSSDERGVPFLDCDYQWGTSRNAVIYGHSTMRSGVHVIFDDLMTYADNPAYADQYGTMVLHRPPDLGGDATYQIFAVLIEEADYDYRQMDFASDEEFVAYYQRIKADSRYQSAVTVEPGDEILTLSTCIFNVGLNDGRLAVIGKRIA